MKKMLWMIPAALLLVGCQSDEPPAGPQTVTLTGADNGKIVTVAPGDRVEIQLDGNRTTGYAWQMKMAPEPGLRFLGQDYQLKPVEPAEGEEAKEEAKEEAPAQAEAAKEEAKKEAPLCGAPGLETFRYEAATPGAWRINGVWVRPWEKEIPKDAARFGVTIRVRE